MLRCKCNTEFASNGFLCEACYCRTNLPFSGHFTFSLTDERKQREREMKEKQHEREMKEKQHEREMAEKLNYLTGFVAAFRDQMHTDIRINPGNNGPSIPTHRALLAARSVIFKNMLDSDECKATSDHTVVSLPELSYEELDSLLEFLYTGELPKEKLDKHVYALFVAAHKYEIPFLQTYCEREIIRSLNTSNALDILEMSETYPNPNIKLKEIAMSFIVGHFEDIVFTPRLDAFAAKYPHLVLQITRDYVTKKRKL